MADFSYSNQVNDLDTIHGCDREAEAKLAEGRTDIATTLYDRGLCLRMQLHGLGHPDLPAAAEVLTRISNHASSAEIRQGGDLSIAENRLQRTLALLVEVASGCRQANLTTCFNLTLGNLAALHQRMGKKEAALLCLREAETLSHMLPASEAAATHLSLCALLSQLSRHSEAERHAAEAVRLGEADILDLPSLTRGAEGTVQSGTDVLREKASALAVAYNNLAVQREFLGRSGECLSLYEKAVILAEAHMGSENPLLQRLRESHRNALQAAADRKASQAANRKPSPLRVQSGRPLSALDRRMQRYPSADGTRAPSADGVRTAGARSNQDLKAKNGQHGSTPRSLSRELANLLRPEVQAAAPLFPEEADGYEDPGGYRGRSRSNRAQRLPALPTPGLDPRSHGSEAAVSSSAPARPRAASAEPLPRHMRAALSQLKAAAPSRNGLEQPKVEDAASGLRPGPGPGPDRVNGITLGESSRTSPHDIMHEPQQPQLTLRPARARILEEQTPPLLKKETSQLSAGASTDSASSERRMSSGPQRALYKARREAAAVRIQRAFKRQNSKDSKAGHQNQQLAVTQQHSLPLQKPSELSDPLARAASSGVSDRIPRAVGASTPLPRAAGPSAFPSLSSLPSLGRGSGSATGEALENLNYAAKAAGQAAKPTLGQTSAGSSARSTAANPPQSLPSSAGVAATESSDTRPRKTQASGYPPAPTGPTGQRGSKHGQTGSAGLPPSGTEGKSRANSKQHLETPDSGRLSQASNSRLHPGKTSTLNESRNEASLQASETAIPHLPAGGIEVSRRAQQKDTQQTAVDLQTPATPPNSQSQATITGFQAPVSIATSPETSSSPCLTSQAPVDLQVSASQPRTLEDTMCIQDNNAASPDQAQPRQVKYHSSSKEAASSTAAVEVKAQQQDLESFSAATESATAGPKEVQHDAPPQTSEHNNNFTPPQHDFVSMASNLSAKDAPALQDSSSKNQPRPLANAEQREHAATFLQCFWKLHRQRRCKQGALLIQSLVRASLELQRFEAKECAVKRLQEFKRRCTRVKNGRLHLRDIKAARRLQIFVRYAMWRRARALRVKHEAAVEKGKHAEAAHLRSKSEAAKTLQRQIRGIISRHELEERGVAVLTEERAGTGPGRGQGSLKSSSMVRCTAQRRLEKHDNRKLRAAGWELLVAAGGSLREPRWRGLLEVSSEEALARKRSPGKPALIASHAEIARSLLDDLIVNWSDGQLSLRLKPLPEGQEDPEPLPEGQEEPRKAQEGKDDLQVSTQKDGKEQERDLGRGKDEKEPEKDALDPGIVDAENGLQEGQDKTQEPEKGYAAGPNISDAENGAQNSPGASQEPEKDATGTGIVDTEGQDEEQQGQEERKEPEKDTMGAEKDLQEVRGGSQELENDALGEDAMDSLEAFWKVQGESQEPEKDVMAQDAMDTKEDLQAEKEEEKQEEEPAQEENVGHFRSGNEQDALHVQAEKPDTPEASTAKHVYPDETEEQPNEDGISKASQDTQQSHLDEKSVEATNASNHSKPEEARGKDAMTMQESVDADAVANAVVEDTEQADSTYGEDDWEALDRTADASEVFVKEDLAESYDEKAVYHKETSEQEDAEEEPDNAHGETTEATLKGQEMEKYPAGEDEQAAEEKTDPPSLVAGSLPAAPAENLDRSEHLKEQRAGQALPDVAVPEAALPEVVAPQAVGAIQEEQVKPSVEAKDDEKPAEMVDVEKPVDEVAQDRPEVVLDEKIKELIASTAGAVSSNHEAYAAVCDLWKCDHCHFPNEVSPDMCVMCDTKRPATASRFSRGSLAQLSASSRPTSAARTRPGSAVRRKP